MSGFETAYLCFGSFVVGSGLAMITTYSLAYPWWRTHVGRMMITYAAAEVLMSLILLLAVVGHVSPAWFRLVWFGLQLVVGCTFTFQTGMILMLRRRRTEGDENDGQPTFR